MTAEELIRQARTWLGVRWRHQGRDRSGIDCVGLLYQAASGAGEAPEDVRAYGLRPGSQPLYEQMRRYCEEVPVKDRRAGDVLVVSIAGEDPQHVMLLTDQGTVIHSSAKDRRVVEHGLDAGTVKRITKVFRFRGLNG